MLSTQDAEQWSIYLWMPGVDARAVGERIRAARKARGLSQRALGDRLPSPADGQYVSRWERGENMPSWPYLRALAAALGVTVASLIPDSEDEPRAA